MMNEVMVINGERWVREDQALKDYSFLSEVLIRRIDGPLHLVFNSHGRTPAEPHVWVEFDKSRRCVVPVSPSDPRVAEAEKRLALEGKA